MSVVPPPPPPTDLPPPTGGPMAPPDLAGFAPPAGPPATAPVEPPPDPFADGWASPVTAPAPSAPVEPPPDPYADGWASPVAPPAPTVPVEPPPAFGQSVGVGFAVGPDPRGHGFGPPTGPPSTGFDGPPAGQVPPPPPKSKRAWAPIAGAVLFGLFRIGLVIVNITAQDDAYDNSPATAPFSTVVVDPSGLSTPDQPTNDEIALDNTPCYDEDRVEVLCSSPHDGEVVVRLTLHRAETDEQAAFLRCLDGVMGVLDELPSDTEVRAYPVDSPDGQPRLDCGVEAIDGSPPLMGRIVY